jgi:hypothetical protein
MTSVPSRIWYSSISTYARDHGMVGEAFHDFVYFLHLLDDEFLSATEQRLEEATQATPAG